MFLSIGLGHTRMGFLLQVSRSGFGMDTEDPVSTFANVFTSSSNDDLKAPRLRWRLVGLLRHRSHCQYNREFPASVRD